MKFQNLVFLCVFVTLFSCRPEGELPFVYCSEGSPSAFNPQITTDGTSSNAASKTIYDTLVSFRYGETTLEPSLAESWTISPDGLTYTFKLRQGVQFHKTPYFTPKRPFNADDVLFSFNRMREKKHPYHLVNGGTYEYFKAMDMGKIIKDIKKLDDYTVQFTLTKPEAPFLANLAMGFASILSAEYAENLEGKQKKNEIDHKPVGTGPFVFKDYKKDTLISYVQHPQYFKGPAQIKKLVFSITPDPSVRFQKLKTGECHFINEPAPADLQAMRDNPRIKVLTREGLNVGYLAMNTQKKPFDNVKVRKAINMALNRQSYIDAIYLGNAVVAKNPIPPTMWSYNTDVKAYELNLVEAKQLLKEAGYPNGFETELWTLPVSRPYNPNGKKMGEMIQADLAKIGVKAKLVTFDWPTYLDKSRKGEHQLIQLGWTGDNGDPDNFLYTLLGCSAVQAGSNVARWCHEEFDSVVQQAKRKTTTSERAELYQKAQEIFKTQVPWVTLAHSVVYRAMLNTVEGYVIDPLGHDIFKTVRMSK